MLVTLVGGAFVAGFVALAGLGVKLKGGSVACCERGSLGKGSCDELGVCELCVIGDLTLFLEIFGIFLEVTAEYEGLDVGDVYSFCLLRSFGLEMGLEAGRFCCGVPRVVMAEYTDCVSECSSSSVFMGQNQFVCYLCAHWWEIVLISSLKG